MKFVPSNHPGMALACGLAHLALSSVGCTSSGLGLGPGECARPGGYIARITGGGGGGRLSQYHDQGRRLTFLENDDGSAALSIVEETGRTSWTRSSPDAPVERVSKPAAEIPGWPIAHADLDYLAPIGSERMRLHREMGMGSMKIYRVDESNLGPLDAEVLMVRRSEEWNPDHLDFDAEGGLLRRQFVIIRRDKADSFRVGYAIKRTQTDPGFFMRVRGRKCPGSARTVDRFGSTTGEGGYPVEGELPEALVNLLSEIQNAK